MFGIRTPVNRAKASQPSPTGKSQNERRSIDEWEAGRTSLSPVKTPPAGTSRAKNTLYIKDKGASGQRLSIEFKRGPGSALTDKLTEARSCLTKTKTSLGEARNLKTDIKKEVIKGLDSLYQIIKELIEEKKENNQKEGTNIGAQETRKEQEKENVVINSKILKKLEEKIQENNDLLKDNGKKLEEIKEEMVMQMDRRVNTTYASAVTNSNSKRTEKTLHSIIVTSKNEHDTGEEVLHKVREAVKATEGWVTVEKVRKAKDRKIIMGCKTIEDRDKIKERIEKKGNNLVVEEAQNKNPLLILRDVLLINSEEEVLKAIKRQNKELFQDLKEEQQKIEIKYKKKARNPYTSHFVISTSPVVWRRATQLGVLHIDLQRVRVADQSPLVQCSTCLGYGHSRRFCTGTSPTCSHCGGSHMKAECSAFRAGETPKCCNCTSAKLDRVEHNSFDTNCPVRQRWDSLARSTIAYC